MNGEIVPLGNMHINSLENVIPIEQDSEFTKNCGITNNLAGKKYDAFALDSSGSDGRVAFIYFEGKKKPEVWFQDLSCDWHFIANSFTDYFRLMIMHLGLPHWQYAYTDVGLDPISKVYSKFGNFNIPFFLAMVQIFIT